MSRPTVFLLICLTSISEILSAQHAVDPTAGYYRVLALVHLTGSGKHGDPVRPEYVPASPARDGIVSWSMQLSDDGKMALVHLVATDHRALDPILNDKRPEVRIFEIGKSRNDDIEKELKKFRKDFSIDSLSVVAR